MTKGTAQRKKATPGTDSAQAAQDVQKVQESPNFIDPLQEPPNALQDALLMEREYLQADPAEYAALVQDIRTGKLDGNKMGDFCADVAGNTPAEIEYRAYLVQTAIGYMQEPDAVLQRMAGQSDKIDKDLVLLKQAQYSRILKKMIEQGADPEQIQYADKWTPEQRQAIRNLLATEKLARMEAYFTSNHFQALQYIHTKDRFALELAPGMHTNTLAVDLFFSLHYPDILPQAEQALTDAQLQEISTLFADLDAYAKEQTPPDADPIEEEIFLHFIEQYTGKQATEEERLALIEKTNIQEQIMPVDKVNDNIFNSILQAAENQTFLLQVDTRNAKAKKKTPGKIATLTCVINFSDIPGSPEKLEAIDRRIMNSIAALFNNGYDVFSISQLCKTAQLPTTSANIKRVWESMSRLRASVKFNNLYEIETLKYKYPAAGGYDGQLVYWEAIPAKDPHTGKIIDAAIHIFREPPLVAFARDRKQITTVQNIWLAVKVYDSKKKKWRLKQQTNDTIAIIDYLVERVTGMRNGRANSNKIKLETVFAACNITTKQQKSRARDTVLEVFYYWNSEWLASAPLIKDYTADYVTMLGNKVLDSITVET